MFAPGATMAGVAVLALFLSANAFMGTLMDHSYSRDVTGVPAFCCMGLMLSQPVFVALIASMLPVPMGIRLTAAVFVLTILVWAITLIPSHQIPPKIMAALLSTAPITVLVSTFPFLLVKRVAGWRLEHADDDDQQPEFASIMGLFVFMTFAAIAIALAKPPSEFAIADVLATALGYAGAVAVLFIPQVYFMLRSRYYLLLLFCIVLVAFVVSLAIMSIDSQINFWWRTGLSSVVAAVFLGVGLPLVVLRVAGYRLTTRADRDRAFKATLESN